MPKKRPSWSLLLLGDRLSAFGSQPTVAYDFTGALATSESEYPWGANPTYKITAVGCASQYLAAPFSLSVKAVKVLAQLECETASCLRSND